MESFQQCEICMITIFLNSINLKLIDTVDTVIYCLVCSEQIKLNEFQRILLQIKLILATITFKVLFVGHTNDGNCENSSKVDIVCGFWLNLMIDTVYKCEFGTAKWLCCNVANGIDQAFNGCGG